MTIKCINTEIITDEMVIAGDIANETGYLEDVFKAMAEAAPAVEGEPFCYVNENARHILESGRRVHADKSNEDGWFNIPLYLHPQPSLAEKIEQIRALKDKYKGPSTRFAEGGYFMLIEVLSILEDKP